jgi:hypothetical protein
MPGPSRLVDADESARLEHVAQCGSRSPRVRAVWLSAIVTIVAGTAGCSSDPDIVATAPSKDPSILHLGNEVTTCEAGRYSGIMNAQPGDTSNISFSGTFEFALVEGLGGEFVVLQNNAELTGTGANGNKFRADIQGGGGCTTGTTFETQLINGTYEIPGYELPFEGSIVGAYSKEFHSFWGDWTTYVHSPLSTTPVTVAGTWGATFLGPN